MSDLIEVFNMIRCEIGEFFILDQGCQRTRGHSAKLYKVRSDKEVMKHFIHGGWSSDGITWSSTWQMRWILSALKINWNEFKKRGRVFYGSR